MKSFRSFACASMAFFCLACADNGDRHQVRVIQNYDNTDIPGNYCFNNRPLTLEDLYAPIDAMKNTQVTTVMMCSGAGITTYRSKYTTMLGEPWGEIADKDTATVNFLKKRYYDNLVRLEEMGSDFLTLALKRIKEDGMEAFLTYRMNDLHAADTTQGCKNFMDKLWYEHPEFWVGDPDIGWNSAGAFDFAHEEVRRNKLDIITEQLEKYGPLMDGIDLDFMRFIVYFKPEEARGNAPLLTQLVRDVRAKVDSVSAAVGHKILLSVRIPPTLEDNTAKGIDIRRWLREDLVDFVSIGVHWTGDPSMPMDDFRKDLGKDLDVPLYGSIDDGGFNPRVQFTHGLFRGMASNILGRGGDGLYLFNYYFDRYFMNGARIPAGPEATACYHPVPQLLNEMGSLETLRRRNKVYAVSDGFAQYQVPQNSPFPYMLKEGADSTARMFIADDVRKDKPLESILFIRAEGDGSCEVFINGKPVTYTEKELALKYGRMYGVPAEHRMLTYIIGDNVLKKGYNSISFKAVKGNVQINHTEILLKYGEPEECGYF